MNLNCWTLVIILMFIMIVYPVIRNITLWHVHKDHVFEGDEQNDNERKKLLLRKEITLEH